MMSEDASAIDRTFELVIAASCEIILKDQDLSEKSETYRGYKKAVQDLLERKSGRPILLTVIARLADCKRIDMEG